MESIDNLVLQECSVLASAIWILQKQHENYSCCSVMEKSVISTVKQSWTPTCFGFKICPRKFFENSLRENTAELWWGVQSWVSMATCHVSHLTDVDFKKVKFQLSWRSSNCSLSQVQVISQATNLSQVHVCCWSHSSEKCKEMFFSLIEPTYDRKSARDTAAAPTAAELGAKRSC